MNIERFEILASKVKLWQQPKEWQAFLEFVETYFRNRNIKNPVVVELGVAYNSQKRFYEEFLGAEHIGVDNSARRDPDILGDTHSEETLNKLKERLGGRAINLLFIDAGHLYEDVKRDYEMYEPLVENIIAIHDVLHSEPVAGIEEVQVRILWNEIMKNRKRYLKVLFSLKNSYMGIGIVIKR